MTLFVDVCTGELIQPLHRDLVLNVNNVHWRNGLYCHVIPYLSLILSSSFDTTVDFPIRE
jgi:hypothetical protein